MAMKAAFDGLVLMKDFVYETVQFMSVDIPEEVEKNLALKPRDRVLVRIAGGVFYCETFGSAGSLAISFPPEVGRTLNLRNKQKIKFEFEVPDRKASA